MSETEIITLVLLAGAVVLGVFVARKARHEKPEGYQVFRKSSSSKADVSVDALLTLVRGGQKIEAIKRYRELTGLGLKESKDAIDELEASGDLPLLNKATLAESAGTMPEIEQLIRQGNQIEAIKRYRDLTGAGLKESKDVVDALAKTLS